MLWYKSKNILDGWEFTQAVPEDLVNYILKKSPDEYKDVNPDTIKNKPTIIVKQNLLN